MTARTTFLLLALTLHTPSMPTAHIERGVAARYRKGVMERVSRVRHMEQPAGTCLIARLTRADLGHWYMVSGRGHTLRCLVVDYAHPRDRARIQARGIIAEVRHEDAAVLCGSTRNPPRQCPIRIWSTR